MTRSGRRRSRSAGSAPGKLTDLMGAAGPPPFPFSGSGRPAAWAALFRVPMVYAVFLLARTSWSGGCLSILPRHAMADGRTERSHDGRPARPSPQPPRVGRQSRARLGLLPTLRRAGRSQRGSGTGWPGLPPTRSLRFVLHLPPHNIGRVRPEPTTVRAGRPGRPCPKNLRGNGGTVRGRRQGGRRGRRVLSGRAWKLTVPLLHVRSHVPAHREKYSHLTKETVAVMLSE